MGSIKTYQDLEALGANDRERADFVKALVREHCNTTMYQVARDAEAYYAKHNLTIEKFQRFLYKANGQAYPDLFSANYKLKTLFFRRFVIQQVQYVLSNGVTFEKDATKERLGDDFDSKFQQLAKKAMVDGVAFGFWNHDHLEAFPFADTPNEPGFAPLYDGDTSLLRAGVRYWSIDESKTKRYTLYEQDGITEYIERQGERIEILVPKSSYVFNVISSKIEGERIEPGANYLGFPIIPLYANDLKASELVGIRESIDCYDFIKSGLANVIDDNSGIFWTIQNAGGMDDVDIAQFLDRLRTVKAALPSSGAEGVEPHTVDVPYQARQAMLAQLRSDLYEDFQLVDMEKIMSGNLTATAIRMGYQNQDDKCGDFKTLLEKFILDLFKIIGIDDRPKFQFNRISNQMEETQMVLLAANVLDDKTILQKLPWITPEEVEEIQKRKDAEDMERLDAVETIGQEVTGDAETGRSAPAD